MRAAQAEGHQAWPQLGVTVNRDLLLKGQVLVTQRGSCVVVLIMILLTLI